MKIKNYLVIAGASLGLSLIYSNQVQADEMPPTNQQSVNNNLSQNDINELDKYVSVENNTFVLNVPENSNISSEKVQMARQEIESVNNSIKNNNLFTIPVFLTTSPNEGQVTFLSSETVSLVFFTRPPFFSFFSFFFLSCFFLWNFVLSCRL